MRHNFQPIWHFIELLPDALYIFFKYNFDQDLITTPVLREFKEVFKDITGPDSAYSADDGQQIISGFFLWFRVNTLLLITT
ncbi:8537_t:CDS:2 [Entrophospora sp. SA101]|nr:8537_t:CDS:2 [Entrophospora sp. SA101]